ncbi:uncharacterized protein ACIBXB_005737 [Morphnus guianensis]
MGFTFITRYFLLLHPPQGQDSSHSSPAPAWGPTHGRQSSMNFSNVGPSHGLQPFTNCSSMGPFHGVQSFRSTLLQHGLPTGSQILPENLLRGLLSPQIRRSCQEPAPAQGSHGVTASFGRIHLLRHGVLHGLQVDICSTVDLHGLQGDSLPHHGLHHGLQGNLCSGAWSISSPSFFTDLGVRRVVSLTCSHSSLRLPFLSVPATFFLLKNVITEALPLSLIGSALAGGRSVLEPAGIGSVRHRGSLQQLLTEATPVTPPATKTLPRKANTPPHPRPWLVIISFLPLQLVRHQCLPSMQMWFSSAKCRDSYGN